jgi:two-component system, cell cycle response regulator
MELPLIKILVCDDDIADRKLLKTFITQISGKNIVLVEADTNERIKDALEKGRFDVVIMDIQMPGKSGMEWLPEIVDNRLAPVIMLSGFGDEEIAAESIEKGATGYIAKNKLSADKIDKSIDSALYKWRQIEQSNASREELERLANYDSLTRLYNRRAIMNLLGERIKYALRYKQPLSMLMLDIDHFKRVNDTYGHIEGDVVLEKVAEILRSQIRETDAAGRYGGEEFMVILSNADSSTAVIVAERIRKSIESEIIDNIKGVSLQVTVSGGIASYIPEEDITSIIKRTDDSLYRAKSNGRNRIEIDTWGKSTES